MEHVKSGEWLGCPGVQERRRQSFVLVPVADAPKAKAEVPPLHVAHPQVRYVAERMSARQIEQLPSRDRQVYQLIARRKDGVGRRALMATLHTRSTGVVDGSLRRLRLRKAIAVREL